MSEPLPRYDGDKYLLARHGPFSLKLSTLYVNVERWMVVDKHDHAVAGPSQLAEMEKVCARLQLLYVEWIMVKPDIPETFRYTGSVPAFERRS